MTFRVPRTFWILALLAPAVALLTAILSPSEPCGPDVQAVAVGDTFLCTHGNDEPPPGVDTTELPTTDELFTARFGVDTPAEVAAEVAPQVVESDASGEPMVAATNAVACIGDGVSGARVQLVYAHAANVTSRYNSVLPLLRQYASDADDIVNASSGRVGDGRRIRFVTNSSCLPQVLDVELSNSGDDTFGNMVSELRAKGLTSNDRKYLVFADAAVGICGLGEVYIDDSRGQTNLNNSGRPMYSRVDTSCWAHAAAHELLHTMGAVQGSAPHATKFGHCTDEVDVMCYKDSADTVTKQVCSRAGQVDCNNDDYFHPNPKAASYLDNKWNVARSRFLESGAAPPRPATTTVTVPATAVPGAPASVSALSATAAADVVWSSTLNDCWFDEPRAAVTTWTCPANVDAQPARITVNITENGITKPYDRDISVKVPASKQSMSSTLAVSDSRIAVGRTIGVTGKYISMGTGAPVAGLPVSLQARLKGSREWKNVGVDKTNRGGAASFSVSPIRNTTYRMRSANNPTWAMEWSPTRDVLVSTKLRTKVNSRTVAGLSTTTVREYSRIRLAGKVSPDKAGRIIKLKKYRDGRWRTIREKRLNDNSGFVFRYRPKSDGTHRLKIVKPNDIRNRGSKRIIRLKVN